MAPTTELKCPEGPRPDVSSVSGERKGNLDQPGTSVSPGLTAESSGPEHRPGMIFLAGAAALSMLCGMIGACLALNLFEKTPHATATVQRTGKVAGALEVEAIQARIAELAKRTETLKATLEARPAGATEDEVAELRVKLVELTKAEGELTPLSGRVATLDTTLNRIATSIESLRDEVSALRSKVAKLDPSTEAATFTPVVAPSESAPNLETTPSEPAPTESSAEPTPSAATTLRRVAQVAALDDTTENDRSRTHGVELFNKGHYAEARAIFNGLRQRDPEDARVWYYSALCTGFSTNQWLGTTEQLVEKGLERERAGTPDRAAIDSAFRQLTVNTGRAWLAGYRERIKSR